MKILVYTVAFLCSICAYSQVGIGTDAPKAQLDIVADSPSNPTTLDGILIPRIERLPVVNPGMDQHGLLVFLSRSTQNHPAGFYFWNNDTKQWQNMGGTTGANFFKPGTSTSPANIEEPMYRTGNIGIGTQEILSKLQISLSSQADIGIKRGLDVDNNNPATDNLTTYGIISNNRSATNGTKYGIKNNVGGLGTGVHYGIFTETYQNSGTNDIYGIFNRVGRTFGSRSNNYGIYSEIGTVQGSGNIYGIYSSALGDHNANVFAGYFAGRVGIGRTPEEEYIFPASRGRAEQVLMLDNAGNMTWSYPVSRNYSTTGGATGGYIITDEVYTLRINDGITSLTIPPANLNRGRIIRLIAWKGTKTKPLIFAGTDDLYDVVNDTSIASITGSQIMTIQSAGNRWILLDIRKAP